MPPDDATEKLQDWHKVAMKLKIDKHEKMRAFLNEMKGCLNEDNQDATSDAPGDHHDHGSHGHHGMY